MSQQTVNLSTQGLQGQAINTGDLELLRRVFDERVVDHDPAPSQGEGAEGFIRFFGGFRAAFPDLQIAIEHLVASDSEIAIAYTVTGTHLGTFLGIPATGRKMKARGMQIARFESGLIVERWGSSDELGILTQLGASWVLDPLASVLQPTSK
jgi:steroid delta-isomerase-like uncharacterized protein